MHNEKWLKNHIEHAEYNRDACLAAADIARLQFRASGRFQDKLEWKDEIRQAWRMRAIAKRAKKDLESKHA